MSLFFLNDETDRAVHLARQHKAFLEVPRYTEAPYWVLTVLALGQNLPAMTKRRQSDREGWGTLFSVGTRMIEAFARTGITSPEILDGLTTLQKTLHALILDERSGDMLRALYDGAQKVGIVRLEFLWPSVERQLNA